MLQSQLRPILLRHERIARVDGLVTSLRQFSIFQHQASDQPSQPTPSGNKSSFPRTSPKKPNASAKPTNVGPRSPNSQRPRPPPQRVVDARSLAAPQAGGQPAKILRSVRFQNSRNPAQARARWSRGPNKGAPSKGRKDGRPKPQKKRSEAGEVDEHAQNSIEDVYSELAQKTRPVPSLYSPQASDFSSMKETWPALPTDVTAYTAGVVEKLSSLSDRFPNGYVPPQELGKRLFQGQNVRFFNEEEKTQALAEAKMLAQQRADKLSQRKGDLVEPEDITFQQMSAKDQKSLIQTLVQGNYPKLQAQQGAKSTILGDIMKSLRNNETYQTTGKSAQFVAKVESLLSSSRPVKRT